jgi:hypothetical protein
LLRWRRSAPPGRGAVSGGGRADPARSTCKGLSYPPPSTGPEPPPLRLPPRVTPRWNGLSRHVQRVSGTTGGAGRGSKKLGSRGAAGAGKAYCAPRPPSDAFRPPQLRFVTPGRWLVLSHGRGEGEREVLGHPQRSVGAPDRSHAVILCLRRSLPSTVAASPPPAPRSHPRSPCGPGLGLVISLVWHGVACSLARSLRRRLSAVSLRWRPARPPAARHWAC